MIKLLVLNLLVIQVESYVASCLADLAFFSFLFLFWAYAHVLYVMVD